MSKKRAVIGVLAALLVSGGLALATPEQQPGAEGMGGMPMGQGMMEQGGAMDQGGMMNVKQHCQKMMGGTGMASGLVPQLPPGNEQLQLKMQAEIMQKVGEIAARYAERIEEAR